MHADINITQIALIVLFTLGFGLLFERLRQPAVLGYILGGVVLSAFNLIPDRSAIQALAELGIIMLLYLIGMELNVQSFKRVWKISLMVTCVQLVLSAGVIFGLGSFFELSFSLSLLLTFSIALSSTAVAIKMLESIGELRTDTGRLAIGILIAQDLVVVPLMLILKSSGSTHFDYNVIWQIGVAVVLLVGVILFIGRKEKFSLPFAHIFTNNEDLAPLAGMIFCFGCAALSSYLNLSSVGAFLGGLIVGNSSERQELLHNTKPIQSVLLMVFFVSVGLLIDFNYIWLHLVKVISLLLFITIGKTLANVMILHWMKQPWARAFLVGLVLSQMGEFAFLFTTVALDAKVIHHDGGQLVISLAALSLTISPLWLVIARRLHDYAPHGVKSLTQLYEIFWGPQFNCLKSKKNVEAVMESVTEDTPTLPPSALK